jgi:hypothetical protein
LEVVLLKVPKPEGEILQVTAVLLLFETAAVMVADPPGFSELALDDTVTVTGTPEGVPLLPHAAQKITLPTTKKIEMLRTAASSDIDQLTNVACPNALGQKSWVIRFARVRPHVTNALQNKAGLLDVQRPATRPGRMMSLHSRRVLLQVRAQELRHVGHIGAPPRQTEDAPIRGHVFPHDHAVFCFDLMHVVSLILGDRDRRVHLGAVGLN